MSSIPSQSESSAPRLLDQVRGKIRLKHYSLRTEHTYVDWIKRFIRHFGKRSGIRVTHLIANPVIVHNSHTITWALNELEAEGMTQKNRKHASVRLHSIE